MIGVLKGDTRVISGLFGNTLVQACTLLVIIGKVAGTHWEEGFWAVLRGSMYSFVATTISRVGFRDVGSRGLFVWRCRSAAAHGVKSYSKRHCHFASFKHNSGQQAGPAACNT